MDRLVALRAGEDGDDGYTVLDNELLEITVATPSHNHAMDFYVGAPKMTPPYQQQLEDLP